MTTAQPTTSVFVILGRVFWMMLGPVILALLAITIVRRGNGWFTAADFAFLGVLGGLLLARWLEFRGGNPQTSTGEPATPAQLQRYALATLLVGGCAWALANMLGNHWLSH